MDSSNLRLLKRIIPDDFSHEQSLVFRTEDGLVIFNSCSHSVADVVMGEVLSVFPGERVKAYIGGLHLSHKTDDEVRNTSYRILKAGISRVITGHCTGDRAFSVLKGGD